MLRRGACWWLGRALVMWRRDEASGVEVDAVVLALVNQLWTSGFDEALLV